MNDYILVLYAHICGYYCTKPFICIKPTYSNSHVASNIQQYTHNTHRQRNTVSNIAHNTHSTYLSHTILLHADNVTNLSKHKVFLHRTHVGRYVDKHHTTEGKHILITIYGNDDMLYDIIIIVYV